MSLKNVADGILDAKEYRDYNLESITNVKAYAENGMNVYLTDDEALKIQHACKEYLEVLNRDGFINANDTYHIIDEQLEV